MKNIFYTIAILIILLSSCVNKSNKNTHVHDDGTEHVDHENGAVTTPKQESFEVEIDTLTIKKDTLKSEQEKPHSHSHEDGHEHTH